MEILVVVTIIAIILGLSAATMKGLTKSKGVRAGIPVMKAAVEEARQLALGAGSNVRVVIYADSANAATSADDFKRYGRFVGIARYYNGSNIQTNLSGAGNWRLVGTGSYLPDGCFFDFDKSMNDKDGTRYAAHISSSGADTATLVANGQCNVDINGSNRLCYFYEFNHLGYPTNPLSQNDTSTGNEAPRVVLSAAKIRRTTGGIEVEGPSGTTESRNYRGFMLARYGEMVDLTNLDEILEE